MTSDLTSTVIAGIGDNKNSSEYNVGVTQRVYKGTFIDTEFDNSLDSPARYLCAGSTSNIDTDRHVYLERCSIDTGVINLFNDKSFL